MDTADTTLLERPPPVARTLQRVQPEPRRLAATKPELNQQERLISAAYLAMMVIVVAFLAGTGLVALLGT